MADNNSKFGDTRVDIARAVSQLLDHSWLALTTYSPSWANSVGFLKISNSFDPNK
jgi:hypothetical protein